MPYKYSAPIDTALHRLCQETHAGLPLIVACFAAPSLPLPLADACLAAHASPKQSQLLPCRQIQCFATKTVVLCLHINAQGLEVLATPVEAASCLCSLILYRQTSSAPPPQVRMLPQHQGFLSSQDTPSACPLQHVESYNTCQLCRSCCHRL